jgi:hypothetical protein
MFGAPTLRRKYSSQGERTLIMEIVEINKVASSRTLFIHVASSRTLFYAISSNNVEKTACKL